MDMLHEKEVAKADLRVEWVDINSKIAVGRAVSKKIPHTTTNQKKSILLLTKSVVQICQ
jgi:hypothetical protein